MSSILIQGQIYDRNILTQTPLKKGEYEECMFNNGDFSEHDFSGFRFINCVFNNCNLSLVKLSKTGFQDIQFKDCKMLGLRFDQCAEFGLAMRFETCQLRHSSFYKSIIKKTHFQNCQLQEVDFSNADLSFSTFDFCDLQGAIFNSTNLDRSDFRTAHHYSIDLENNRIKKAQFSLNGIIGLLDKYDLVIE